MYVIEYIGSDKFMEAIKLMTGRRVPYWFPFCWKFLTPLISMGIFVFMLAAFKPLKYNNSYEYPLSAQLLGVAMAIVSMVCVPVVFCFRFVRYPGSLRQLSPKHHRLYLQGGLYVFQLFDHYTASGFILLWVCFFDTVVISMVIADFHPSAMWVPSMFRSPSSAFFTNWERYGDAPTPATTVAST